ncbi:MAG: 16S rRNA (guanine(966)-N(2))-methyltransferase RsmD [Alphaproteobacteria bacterium]|nr:16S rRNA (guanine(966)-N(2))-methyltransferase RsmD [Alphaproteobacteria bacterium]MBT8476890.1 16S rRNA (guanine(966)-N(2))-methyltransferase RsmD [Alphaproteobacteria bacterium]
MRIVGGTWRGRALAGVGKGDPAAHLRPTSDRVRESLFNMLAHGRAAHDLDGARVLDLFAGTGALGLEALSRGAEAALFVDSGRAAAALIARNIALLGAEGRARHMTRNATRLGQNPGAPYDLVFLDPPYGQDLGQKALSAAQDGGWIAPGALIVWEEAAPQPAPPGFSVIDTRAFGQTHVTFLRFDAD